MAEYSVTHTVKWTVGSISRSVAGEYTIDSQDSSSVLDLEQLRLTSLSELRDRALEEANVLGILPDVVRVETEHFTARYRATAS